MTRKRDAAAAGNRPGRIAAMTIWALAAGCGPGAPDRSASQRPVPAEEKTAVNEPTRETLLASGFQRAGTARYVIDAIRLGTLAKLLGVDPAEMDPDPGADPSQPRYATEASWGRCTVDFHEAGSGPGSLDALVSASVELNREPSVSP